MKKISFEVKQASKIVGVSPRILRYWSEIGALTPYQDAKGAPGVRRRFSFENLIEATILRELRKQGVTIILGSKALEKLKEKDFGRYKIEGKEKKFCLLQIVGGKKINVLTVDDVKNTNKLLDNFSVTLMAAMAALPFCDFLEQKKDNDFQIALEALTAFKKLYEEGETTDMLKKLNTYVTMSAFAGWFLKDLKESTVIIPIHALLAEVQDKINNFEFM